MDQLNTLWNFLSHYKYLIVIVLGVLLVGFVDENSFLRRIKLDMQISDLKEEIARYNEQNEADMARLRDLKQNPKAIERVAREQYFMKADDEDIYVLTEDQLPETVDPENNETSE